MFSISGVFGACGDPWADSLPACPLHAFWLYLVPSLSILVLEAHLQICPSLRGLAEMLPLTFPAPRGLWLSPAVFPSGPGTPLAQLLLGAGMSLTALAQGLKYSRCSIYEQV